MAKIPLRAYINEIETIIEQQQIEEAIAHCRHILQIFPKHIDTYRLLGKAYLESRRYNNAVNIFERVLSAIPYDFVSHVGMSITREDEANLDAAIWHMERAFEGQPYNAAIQGELRRLYGKRDGMAPPKIQLTRGALARMYAKGNLFQQAIAELRAAIAEDPQRLDLQVFLARMYHQSGENVKAIETCGSLTKKLPYCLDANLILAQLLEITNRAKEAETYKKRVQELDPYQAHVNPITPDKQLVQDQAVLIEQLIWDGGPAVSTTDQPDWASSAGVKMIDEEKEEIPDWAVDTEALAEDTETLEETIPDFMKDAGWEPSTGEFDESVSVTDFDHDEDTPEDLAEAVEGDIPEWLQQMAPPETIDGIDETAKKPSIVSDRFDENIEDSFQDSENIPEWLRGLDAQSGSENENAELPEWLQGAINDRESEREIELSSLDSEDTGLPDWLASAAIGTAGIAGLAKLEQSSYDEEDEESKKVDPSIPGDDLETDIHDRLQDVVEEQEIEELETSKSEDGVEISNDKEVERIDLSQGDFSDEGEPLLFEEDSLPDWIQEVVELEEPSEDVVQVDEDSGDIDLLEASGVTGAALIGIAAASDDDSSDEDIDDILETEDKGVTDEELLTSSEERDQESSEWVQEEFEDGGKSLEPKSEEKVDETTDEDIESIDGLDWIPEIPETDSIIDEAGIEIGTDENLSAETEDIPEWLQDISKDIPPIAGDTEVLAKQHQEEEIEDIPPWLQDVDEDKVSERKDTTSGEPITTTELVEDSDIAFTWLEDLEIEDEKVDDQVASPGSSEGQTIDSEVSLTTSQDEAEQFEDADSAMAWLESLAVQQGVSEDELITSPDERSETPPEWVQISVDTSSTDEEATHEIDEEIIEVKNEFEGVTDLLLGETETLETTTGIEEYDDSSDLIETDVELADVTTSTEDEDFPPEISDVDEAIAWLESLAVKQGVSEDELLTSPEERSDTPPDWIREIETDEKPLESVEQSFTQGISELEESEDVSLEPPSWITDGQIPEDEEFSWLPSDDNETESQLIDLNQASLIQLERLPGIGFRRAQSITAYREEHGDFTNMHDLLNVPGIDHDTLELLRAKVSVQAIEMELDQELIPETQLFEPQDIAADDKYHELQLTAQTKLNDNRVSEAMDDYHEIINHGQRINQVIDDLIKASKKFPQEVTIMQALGDAYMQANKLQEALDAYSKAQNLL